MRFRSTMIVATLLALGAPRAAVAEHHVRTAPYDFGSRCVYARVYQTLQPLPPPLEPYGYEHVTTCQEDLVAQMGVLAEGHIIRDLRPGIDVFVRAQSFRSYMGISFNAAGPGTVTVQVDALAVRSTVCVYITDTSDPEGSGISDGRTCSAEPFGGPVTLSHEAAVPLAGQYWVVVRAQPDASISGLVPPGGGAIVKGISYELSGS